MANDIGEMLARQAQIRVDKDFVTVVNGMAVIGGKIKLGIKSGSRIMILEDQFKSSYDCRKCGGSGQNRFGTPCSDCNGKGALVVIPDVAKSKPTSGTIIVMGPECSIYKVGERVAFTTYTGHLIPFKGNSRIRIMDETDPMCYIEDIEDASTNDPIEFVDTDTAYPV